MTTLVHAMHARGARLGLQVMCEAGGLANATILERLYPGGRQIGGKRDER